MASRHRRRLIWLYGSLVALPAWVGCSLQNFDYLQDGTDAGSDATTGPETGTKQDAAEDSMSSMDASAHDTGAGVDSGIKDAAVDSFDGYDGYDGYVPPPNLVENPDFNNNYQGWTFVPSNAQGNTAFIQVPQGANPTPQGQPYELATYSQNNAFTVDMSQTITGLPDGVYTFAAWFNRGTNNQTYIYAKGCDGNPDGGILSTNIPITAPTTWEEVLVSNITVTGGSCQIGMFVDAQATQWLNADHFYFWFNGPVEAGAPDAAADAAADATTD